MGTEAAIIFSAFFLYQNYRNGFPVHEIPDYIDNW